MLTKELEILKHIEELYNQDVEDEEIFAKSCQGKETQISAWREAFADYGLHDVLLAIDNYFVKKSSKTRPNIAQIKAMLNAYNTPKEEKSEDVAVSAQVLPDYDVRYMREDVAAGDCHHNLYYYTRALKAIRNNEYPYMSDIWHPTKADIHEVMEEMCEKKTGNKHEFLSKNDMKAAGINIYSKEKMNLSDILRKIN